MKKIIALMLFLTFFAHANDSEPGSQYLKAAEAGDRRAQYFLADSWFSSGDLSKAEFGHRKPPTAVMLMPARCWRRSKSPIRSVWTIHKQKFLQRKRRKRAVKKVK